MADRPAGAPMLEVRDLNLYYGRSHALQGVDLTLEKGVLSVVGRNGMGKTTLCKAIMGLERAASGSVSLQGRAITGLSPSEVARLGVGYVPQGRRLWPSLTVDEHLKLVARKGGAWTVERIYATFPRLAERRSNGGAQLSGGEQQMLAIGRALLLNPKLLVMDEPTEGLAPVIVSQVRDMLIRLGEEGDVYVLVIEQNIGVACSVSDRVAIMVNGRIDRVMEASRLAADRDLQQALLGVGRHAHDEISPETEAAAKPAEASPGLTKIWLSNPKTPTRWTPPVPVRVIENSARTLTKAERIPRLKTPRRPRQDGVTLIAGTMDTKGAELGFLRDRLKEAGLRVMLADLSTSGKPSGAEIPPHVIAGHHPRGASGVFTGDRGAAVAAMALAFKRWISAREDIAGVITAGGSGAASLTAPGFRALGPGVPKIIISTVASGDVSAWVGGSDIMMMNPIADIQGLNSLTREALANGASALAGMIRDRRERPAPKPAKPAAGLTMFGVTTPCVSAAVKALEADFECLVFHATGAGGRAMEELAEDGALAGCLDLTTTEICDLIAGGVYPAAETRLDGVIRSALPWVGAPGALDMVNFHGPETVPEKYRARRLHAHNPNITLMRTTAEENAAAGRFIGEKMNLMTGPARFLIPEGGFSALDATGEAFHDREANTAFIKTLEMVVRESGNRRIIRSAHHINDPEFAVLAAATFREITAGGARRSAGGA